MATRTLSLFAGCGGLDLAVGLAVPDARVVCYVEREVSAARILAARIADGSLDDAPIWSDVRSFDGRRWRGAVDLIVGGFPCTDLSVAGKQEGIHGEHSGLWFEYLRIIREVQPRLVFIENVPPVLAFPAGATVLGGLASAGFDAEWMSLRASDVGAPHQRKRVFVLAYRDSRGFREWPNSTQSKQARRDGARIPEGCDCELAHSPLRGLGMRGEPSGGDRQPHGGDEGLENSQHAGPSRARSKGESSPTTDNTCRSGDVADPGDGLIPQPRRGQEGRDGAGSAGEDAVPDAIREGLEGWQSQRCDDGGQRAAAERDSLPIFPPGPDDTAAWRELLGRYPWLAPAIESGVRGFIDELAVVVDQSRADSLRAIGNGVVAIQGAAAFICLAQRAGLDFGWGGR